MKWQDVTEDEMKAWFSVVNGMGLTQLKFSKQTHKNTGFCRSTLFPRDCYLQILRYIHFVDESTAVTDRKLAGYNKFYKIRYIFTYLVPKFPAVCHPNQYLAIDESVVTYM